MKHKEPTTTALVTEALRATDDFMSYAMLVKATGRNPNQISAACFSLREHRVVDVIVEPDGKAWWYALSPEEDTRIFKIDERTPESKPRKPRVGRRTVGVKP